MLILKILGIAIMVLGFGTVLEAKNIVNKRGLAEKAKVTFEHEMNEQELAEYKFTKAQVNVKMAGMLIALPGIILTLIMFK